MIFNSFLILSVYTFILMMPAYMANVGGLLFGGTTPLDLNKNSIDGDRLIGDGVTWKGLILGSLFAILISALMWFLIYDPFIYDLFPVELQQLITITISKNIFFYMFLGFLLGFGALIGDALGSYIKRRLKIKRGNPAPILDQLDFAVVALFFASFIIPLSLEIIIFVLIFTIFIHLSTNILAYLIGAKDVWY